MDRPPTAEDVLELWAKWDGVEESHYGEGYDERCKIAKRKFIEAFDQWQAAKGPVTREWFVERFGAERVEIARQGNCTAVVCTYGDILSLTLHDPIESVRYGYTITISHTTRADIETLVRVLGGET